MDKKKRRSKSNKSNNNKPQTPTKVSSFDTSGLADHLECWFKDADDLIQSRFTMLSKQENFLTATKDQALREIDSCFDKIIQIATRRKQLLKGEVSDVYSNQLEDVLEKKENVLLAGMFLETLLRQAKEMATVAPAEKVGFEDMIHREIERHCNTAITALPEKNLIEFDRTVEVSEPTERKIRMLGKVRAEHSLPAMVSVEECEAIVGLTSKLSLKVLDASGKALPVNLVKMGRISFQLKDNHGELVHYRLDNIDDENKIRLFFRPLSEEKHYLTVLFSSHSLKEIEIQVRQNTPTLAFGPQEGLMQPNALCSLKDGRVCVADSGASKLLLFSETGVLLAEATFPDGGFVPFDVTTNLKSNYILCSGSAFDDQDDTLSASPDDCETSFPSEIPDEGITGEPGELLKEKDKLASTQGSVNLTSRTQNACLSSATSNSPETDDLKMAETLIDDVRVRYVEKRGYITITGRNQIVLGEVNTNAVLVYDIEGHFLRVIPSPSLDCLGSVQCKPDGQVVVSDIGNCSLLAGTPEMGLCERWGSVETESKQLLLPLGLALDSAGNLLVADGGGPKVFIYGEYGEHVGCLELGSPVSDTDKAVQGSSSADSHPHGSPGGSRGVEVSVIPWALTVVGGSIWVIDNNSHKVLRYSYSIPN